MSETNESTKWFSVRLPKTLIDKVDQALQKKDDYGMPKYRSRSHLAQEAVKRLLSEEQATPQEVER